MYKNLNKYFFSCSWFLVSNHSYYNSVHFNQHNKQLFRVHGNSIRLWYNLRIFFSIYFKFSGVTHFWNAHFGDGILTLPLSQCAFSHCHSHTAIFTMQILVIYLWFIYVLKYFLLSSIAVHGCPPGLCTWYSSFYLTWLSWWILWYHTADYLNSNHIIIIVYNGTIEYYSTNLIQGQLT